MSSNKIKVYWYRTLVNGMYVCVILYSKTKVIRFWRNKPNSKKITLRFIRSIRDITEIDAQNIRFYITDSKLVRYYEIKGDLL